MARTCKVEYMGVLTLQGQRKDMDSIGADAIADRFCETYTRYLESFYGIGDATASLVWRIGGPDGGCRVEYDIEGYITGVPCEGGTSEYELPEEGRYFEELPIKVMYRELEFIEREEEQEPEEYEEEYDKYLAQGQ